MVDLRQCAWCLLVMDRRGTYTLEPGRKIKSATHGICPRCKDQVRAEIEASPLLVAA
jgi:DICT domain-containing protein